MAGKKPLVVILGPTAVGKTGLAVMLARALDGEIVGADSRQIYRYMDIGTAKPTPEQQRMAAHHLIDIVEPDEKLSLAQYQGTAYAAIDGLHRRGRLPLLVGGTGLYITAVVEGWSIPEVPPNEALRAELEAFAGRHGAAALHDRLRAHDPEAAAAIDRRNIRRVIRALEVCLETGRPFSELQRRRPPPYDILQIGLTLERARLYERAETRIERMVEQGFVAEVERLLDMGYAPGLPAMSALGYREMAACVSGAITRAEAIAATQSATRDFIRRQFTWFRNHDQGILWHNKDELDEAELIEMIAARLPRSG